MTPVGDRPELWLWGFMGTGKTTVGRLLAERRGVAFVDLDAEVERAEGQTIAQIFAAEGERSFRAAEARALMRLFDTPAPRVVALGGGSLLDEGLRARALREVFVVVLTASPVVLVERTSGSARPLLEGETKTRIDGLLAARRAAYAEAHATVVSEGPIDGVVETLAHLWRHA